MTIRTKVYDLCTKTMVGEYPFVASEAVGIHWNKHHRTSPNILKQAELEHYPMRNTGFGYSLGRFFAPHNFKEG